MANEGGACARCDSQRSLEREFDVVLNVNQFVRRIKVWDMKRARRDLK
jgi:hypothetical protein